jgi:DNA-binding NarL/FixJ family response regulator
VAEQRLRVVVADDERLIRAGLRMLLSDSPDVEVVGEAADGIEAIEACTRLAPDVVLMDIRMPRMDGIEATRHVVRAAPRPSVLVLTTFDADVHVHAALLAGAAGFLLKDSPEERIVAAIRAAHTGVSLLDPVVTLRLVAAHSAAGGTEDPALATLTERETEVLRWMATGASNDEIARALAIGPATVKTHVSRVLAKLGVLTRTQAVVRAYQARLVVPDRSL